VLQAALDSSRGRLTEAWSSFATTLLETSAICSAATGSAPLVTDDAAAEEASTEEASEEAPAEETPAEEPTPTPAASTPTAEPEETAGTPEAEESPAAEPTPSESVEGLGDREGAAIVLLSSTSSVADCVDALALLGAAQAEVTEAQAEADDAVDDLVAYAASAGTGSTATPTPSGTPGSGTAPAASSTGGTSAPAVPAAAAAATSTTTTGSSTSRTNSQGTTSVAVAEADLAEAELALTNAELARANTTLTAPISGRVAESPFVEGEQMTTSDAITIVGPGSVQLTIEVPEASVRDVAVGQTATVAATSGTTSAGMVTAIGILPSGTDSGVSYPVTITVSDPDPGLAPGTTGAVTITVASADKAVLVPVSALTRTGDAVGTVSVLGSGGTLTTVRVSLGAVGATHVQVTDGLSAGDLVVLADRTADLPSGSLSSRLRGGSSLTGGSSGLPPGALGGLPARPGR